MSEYKKFINPNYYTYTSKELEDFIKGIHSKGPKFEKLRADDSGKVYYEDKQVIPLDKLTEFFKQVYEDPKAGFKGRTRLFAYLKDKYYGFSQAMLGEFLRRMDGHQVHRQFTKQRVSVPIVASAPLHHWQADLIDLSPFAGYNRGIRYLLNVIDVFSKKLWCRPLRNKETHTVVEAMSSIIAEGGAPERLQSDNGSEFVNHEFKELLHNNNIKQILSASHNPQSNGQIERVNQTLKKLIKRYMTTNNTNTYIDVLDDLVSNYNTTIHSTTRETPEAAAKATDDDAYSKDRAVIHKRISQKAEASIKANQRNFSRLVVGDWVRISELTNPKSREEYNLYGRVLGRSYMAQVYQIKKISNPRTIIDLALKRGEQYQLADEEGKVLPRWYRRDKLIKAVSPDKRIEVNNLSRPVPIPEVRAEDMKGMREEEKTEHKLRVEALQEQRAVEPIAARVGRRRERVDYNAMLRGTLSD